MKRNGVTPSVERLDLETVIQNELSQEEKTASLPLLSFVKVTSGVLVCRPELLGKELRLPQTCLPLPESAEKAGG